MAKGRVIAGIELGSSKVATIIAQVNVDEVTYATSINIIGVSSIESKGIRRGQIVDIEEAVEATIESVESAERMAGYNLDTAYVAIGGAHISSQNSHGVVAVSNPDGEITVDDVDRVIEAASAVSLPSSRETLHILPKEYIVDGESGVRDPVGMSGIRLEVKTHIITASAAALKNLKRAMEEVGINVNEFVYSGLAASYSALTKTERELGCVLVDIGGGMTSLAVYIEGAVHYSSAIPIGAKNVTNDLAIGLRVSLDAAEKIKVALSRLTRKAKTDKSDDLIDLTSLGISGNKKVSRKTLTQGIIRPRLNEIFSMVKLQLDKENLGGKVPSGVIITGGGAESVGVEDSAKRMLSLPVRIGKPRKLGGLVDDIISPAFATPAGLVIYGTKKEPQQSLTSITRKIKLPSSGIVGKFIDTVKDLLP